MRITTFDHFYDKLRSKTRFLPNEIQFELTYRCNLRCGHCYCSGLEDDSCELSAHQIKKILDRLRRAGGFRLSFTGGEPLAREDFLEIYAYAKQRGYLITIFSNGLLWSEAFIRALKKSPPYSIEITVNGITPKTYETITGVAGSFELLKEKAARLFESGLPVIVKSNLMRPNQGEVHRIKRWVQEYLGAPRPRHFFKYDPFVYPRLNGDPAPLAWRLSFDDIQAAVAKDADMRSQHEEELCRSFPPLRRSSDILYQCESWQDRLFVNPAGQARFCLFSDQFSFDVREYSGREGMRRFFSPILVKKFKTRSRCRACSLRPVCNWCPAKARLEARDEEKPILSYCRYAKKLAQATIHRSHEKNKLSAIRAAIA